MSVGFWQACTRFGADVCTQTGGKKKINNSNNNTVKKKNETQWTRTTHDASATRPHDGMKCERTADRTDGPRRRTHFAGGARVPPPRRVSPPPPPTQPFGRPRRASTAAAVAFSYHYRGTGTLTRLVAVGRPVGAEREPHLRPCCFIVSVFFFFHYLFFRFLTFDLLRSALRTTTPPPPPRRRSFRRFVRLSWAAHAFKCVGKRLGNGSTAEKNDRNDWAHCTKKSLKCV